MAKRPEVIIVWSNDGESMCTLAYNNGNGPIRVYYKDRYDARCEANLPYFREVGPVLAYIAEHPGLAGQVQLDVRNRHAVKSFGIPLAEVATP
jgi:hypothetical protein